MHWCVHKQRYGQKHRWFLNKSPVSDAVLETQSCRHWGLRGRLCAQVSMAGRSMNRLAQNGSRRCRLLHPCVQRQQRCNWHLCVVIKGDRQRSCSPRGRRLNISQSFLLSSSFSSSPSLHLLIAPISPAQLRLHLCSRGNPLFPAGLLVPPLR